MRNIQIFSEHETTFSTVIATKIQEKDLLVLRGTDAGDSCRSLVQAEDPICSDQTTMDPLSTRTKDYHRI